MAFQRLEETVTVSAGAPVTGKVVIPVGTREESLSLASRSLWRGFEDAKAQAQICLLSS